VLGEAFEAAAQDGDVVLLVKASNAYPVEKQDRRCLFLVDYDPAEGAANDGWEESDEWQQVG